MSVEEVVSLLVSAAEVSAILRVIEPDLVRFRWEVFGDGLDASESYGTLYLTKRYLIGEVEKEHYKRWSLAHETIRMLENVLYTNGWAPATVENYP